MVEAKETEKGFKKTDVGIIPHDWGVKKVGDVALIVGGGTPSTFNSNYWNGDINWFTPSEIGFNKYSFESKRKITKEGLENSSAKMLPIGTILLTSRASIGDVSILKVESCTNQGFQSLIPKDNIDNEFIYYLTLTLKNALFQNASGSTFLEISPSRVKSIQIPFPPAKAEQAAIAAALNDADALITQLEKLIVKKRAIKHGAMQVLLKPKGGWKEKVLGEVATLKARIGWQGLTTAEYRNTGDYFLITGTEFKNGFIDWERCFYVEAERYKQDKNIQVKENDVLVTKDGTIGKVALIKSVPKSATLNSGVFVVRPSNNAFHPEFFYYLLLSDVFRKFLAQLSAGSTINHLYQKDFVTFKFLAPETMDEQKAIAKIFSDMDAEILALEIKLEKYKMLKQGMMQNLLTGKIRLI